MISSINKIRAFICKVQIKANNKYRDIPLNGVKVKDKNGKVLYLNSTKKTDWNKELQKVIV